jgi:hypothetical protein
MFNDVKSEFVQLGDGVDPETIPGRYKAYYDRASEMFRRFGHFKGADDLHPNVWPMLCLLADQQQRIEDLESRIFAREDTRKPSIDLRTREGRALKEAQPVGA